jgi:hypothetical protein
MSTARERPPRLSQPRPFRVALLTAIVLQAVAGLASADDQQNVLVMRAADLEAQGRCDEAVALYRSQEAADARIALVAGRCQVRARDYADAIATLGTAREMPDAPAEVDLYLGVAQYHQGDLEVAEASLDRARARGADGALLDLYTGLLQLQAEDARNAALSLERARRADSRAVEPVASYYAFLAWRSLDEQERAEAALARLRATDQDGPWIAEAERILAEGGDAVAPSWWANAEAGLEYDSNVTVRGGGVSQVFINGDEVSGKDDGRGAWSIDGGIELFRNEKWSGGVLASYTGNAHFDINEFDTHYPTASGWVDHHFSEKTTLRARYDYAYAWLNYDPYVSMNTIGATLFQGWDAAGRTELTLFGAFFDFKYDRVDPGGGFGVSDIDRDGKSVNVEALHRYEPGLHDLELRAGYLYTHYNAEGREFDFDLHRFLLGFDVTLPLEVAWDGWVAFTYQPYEHESIYVDDPPPSHPPNHRDRIWEFGSEFEKFVSEDVSVLARYRFTDTGSNTDVYDYDRHVVGAYVRIRFR